MRRSAPALIVLLVASAPLGTRAHHNSNAYFDTREETTLEGTVTRFDWRNPHSYIYLDSVDDDGGTVSWRIEGAAVAIMRRMGWDRDTLRAGDRVTLTVNPSRKEGSASALLRGVQVAGREVPPVGGEAVTQRLATGDAAPATRAQGVAGTWVTLLDLENPDLIGFFNDPSDHPLTAAGSAAVAAFDERTMHNGLDCIPFTAPLLMVVPDTKQIEVRGEVVLIRGEFDGTARMIYLDGRAPAGPTIHGHSTGRWDGDALVIETTDFAAHRSGNAFSLPSGAGKRLTERLDLDADGTTLTYTFELSDPEFLAEPVAGQLTWAYRSDIAFEMLECSLDNSRLYLED